MMNKTELCSVLDSFRKAYKVAIRIDNEDCSIQMLDKVSEDLCEFQKQTLLREFICWLPENYEPQESSGAVTIEEIVFAVLWDYVSGELKELDDA